MNTQALIADGDIEGWVHRLFGATSGPGHEGVALVVKVDGRVVGHGTNQGEDLREAIQELTRSWEMYEGGGLPGDTLVAPPSLDKITAALSVLTNPRGRRQCLGAALQIFGRRVMEPLESSLNNEVGVAQMRLSHWRERMFDAVTNLGLSEVLRETLRRDVERNFTDDYLRALSDLEDQTIRPQMAELAHKVLDALGMIFHRALDRFGANASQVAGQIVRGVPARVPLRELPGHLKQGFVRGVGDYLSVETSAELQGTLSTLSAQYRDVVPPEHALAFDDAWYRDLAEQCWSLIATQC